MIPTFILLSLFIAFLWGIQPVIHKYLLKKINGITLMLISSIVYLLAVCLTVVVMSKTNKNIVDDLRTLTSTDFIIIIVTAIFTVFLANMIYYYVLKDHETSFIASLMYTSPIFTLILSYLFLKEKIEWIGILGIILMFLGVGCVSFNHTPKLFDTVDDIE